MDPTAEALAAAKKRIVELQSQMTDRILKMAAEVAKLTEVVTEREAREFLRVTCNVPSSELSIYVKFADKLAGSEDVLAKARQVAPQVDIRQRRNRDRLRLHRSGPQRETTGGIGLL